MACTIVGKTNVSGDMLFKSTFIVVRRRLAIYFCTTYTRQPAGVKEILCVLLLTSVRRDNTVAICEVRGYFTALCKGCITYTANLVSVPSLPLYRGQKRVCSTKDGTILETLGAYLDMVSRRLVRSQVTAELRTKTAQINISKSFL